VNDEHVLAFIEAVDGADFDAVGVLALNALIVDDVGHGISIKLGLRAYSKGFAKAQQVSSPHFVYARRERNRFGGLDVPNLHSAHGRHYMASNKENRPSKPKTEGEKHQGVGVNPQKYKGNTLSDSDKAGQRDSSSAE
jgi:hypothetical protein